jgi:hypothetical protein
MKGVFFLSTRLIGVDTYVSFSYILSKAGILNDTTFVGFNRIDAEQIFNSDLLNRASSEVGNVVFPQGDSFLHKLNFYLKLLKIVANKDIRLFFYLPYNLCNIHIYLLYLITRIFGGKGYILGKSSSVTPKHLLKEWSNVYSKGKSLECRYMKNARNNDGIICFNSNLDKTVDSLTQFGCNFHEDILEVSSPYNYSAWIEFSKRHVDKRILTDNTFLLVLAKVETSIWLTDGNSLTETVRRVLGFIYQNFSDYNILVKPHPLDYQEDELMECFNDSRCTVLDTSPLGYSFFTKRVFTIGPTNLIGLLSNSRKIDFSVYKEFDNLYDGYNYVNICNFNKKKIIKLIEDDYFYDKNVSHLGLDTFIGSPKSDIKSLKNYINIGSR